MATGGAASTGTGSTLGGAGDGLKKAAVTPNDNKIKSPKKIKTRCQGCGLPRFLDGAFCFSPRSDFRALASRARRRLPSKIVRKAFLSRFHFLYRWIKLTEKLLTETFAPEKKGTHLLVIDNQILH
jgi:ribosomal protein S14